MTTRRMMREIHISYSKAFMRRAKEHSNQAPWFVLLAFCWILRVVQGAQGMPSVSLAWLDNGLRMWNQAKWGRTCISASRILVRERVFWHDKWPLNGTYAEHIISCKDNQHALSEMLFPLRYLHPRSKISKFTNTLSPCICNCIASDFSFIWYYTCSAPARLSSQSAIREYMASPTTEPA